ncbi:type VI secretion system tube protein Hcp [Nitrosopumilus sp. K4]|nr:type VI secretion system tube protein Hcp [Nitrosopumilus sp. K4]
MYDNAFAAVDMFMKIDGIEGESQDKKHKDEIDVLAWSWGASQSSSSPTGGGKVNVQDVFVTKFIDKSTPILFKSLTIGKHIGSAEISVVDRDYSGNEAYLTYTLENVLITSVSTGGSSGEDRLTENISLNFEKIRVIYQPFENKKKSGEPVEFTFTVERPPA